MNAAVASAKEAFKTWGQTSVMSRQAVMFKYQELIKKHLKDIAGLITIEQGKTLPDAEGDVIRGLQVVEHCCSMTNLLLGETLPGLILDSLILGTPLCEGLVKNKVLKKNSESVLVQILTVRRSQTLKKSPIF